VWGGSLATHAPRFGAQIAETAFALPELIACLTASFGFGMLSQCILSSCRCKVCRRKLRSLRRLLPSREALPRSPLFVATNPPSLLILYSSRCWSPFAPRCFERVLSCWLIVRSFEWIIALERFFMCYRSLCWFLGCTSGSKM